MPCRAVPCVRARVNVYVRVCVGAQGPGCDFFFFFFFFYFFFFFFYFFFFFFFFYFFFFFFFFFFSFVRLCFLRLCTSCVQAIARAGACAQ